jgi:hypothetical protein
LLVGDDALDVVLLKDADSGFADLRLVVIDCAGIKERHLFLSVGLGRSGTFAIPLGESLCVEGGEQSVPVDAQILFHQPAHRGIPIRPVDQWSRPTGQPSHPIRVPEYFVGEAGPVLLGLHHIGAHDGPREIDFPFVRRHVGADRVAKLALVAEIDDVIDLLIFDSVRLAKILIHQLKQVHKRRAEGMAERASIADVEHPQNFRPGRLRVPELRCVNVKLHPLCFLLSGFRWN